MPRKLNLALVCMQVCLEGQDFWIAPARLPVEVQTSEVLNVSHPSCVHLHEILYPLGLILRALQGKWSSQFFFFFFWKRLSKWSFSSLTSAHTPKACCTGLTFLSLLNPCQKCPHNSIFGSKKLCRTNEKRGVKRCRSHWTLKSQDKIRNIVRNPTICFSSQPSNIG